eukprot:9484202-Pyramimonas_sp.AAC.3
MGACCQAIRTPASANMTALGMGNRVRVGARLRHACIAREARGKSEPTRLGSPGVKCASAATVCDPTLAAAPEM